MKTDTHVRKPWTPARVKRARARALAGQTFATEHQAQAAFAAVLGKSWRSLYRWEQGEVEPDADCLDLWEARNS
jgi:DNA-binding transcriptional regulator YiaG